MHLHKIRRELAGWMFVAPALAFLAAFVFIPAGYVLFISFEHWNLLDMAPPHFAGLVNYAHLLHSQNFLQAVANTFWLSLGLIVIAVPVALLTAVLVDLGLRGSNVYRAILFAPYVLPLVASGLAWTWIYNANYGLVNQILALARIQGPNWLGSNRFALPAVIVTTAWQFLGYYMLIFLSGLQGVPQTLKEAAAVDGAGHWETFWRVTFPSLTPTLLFVLVVSSIQSLQTFDQVYVMTDGGPAGATATLVYYIYQAGFQMSDIGVAAAASVVLLLFLAALTWIQLRLSRLWVVYEA